MRAPPDQLPELLGAAMRGTDWAICDPLSFRSPRAPTLRRC
jgi:hypothetical protein